MSSPSLSTANCIETSERRRKRAYETLMETHYAQYGVTNGVLKSTGGQRSCGFLCKGWPSWMIAAQARGWFIMILIIKENLWLKEIKDWFPETQVMTYNNQTTLCALGLGVDIWFCDTDPPRKLNLWGSEAMYIVSERRVRHMPAGWETTSHTLRHSDCGGVTTGCWRLHVYRRPGAPSLDQPMQAAGRDLRSVLDTKITGRLWTKPPEHKSPRLDAIEL